MSSVKAPWSAYGQARAAERLAQAMQQQPREAGAVKKKNPVVEVARELVGEDDLEASIGPKCKWHRVVEDEHIGIKPHQPVVPFQVPEEQLRLHELR
eukprot:CAMPEP_0119311086 /NCGR_PEP_ID=MMETSP1333-20130426/21611_1 /TAXON_ID=418940 /ORGANISM="Scyphosphaera apsteinii, Strain RCC1455" /LENGTH=96 /DNA_ID=CAMNT_0007315389 /DNA_START=485 /DNA_END=774 /DNA_ORIENTATION=-